MPFASNYSKPNGIWQVQSENKYPCNSLLFKYLWKHAIFLDKNRLFYGFFQRTCHVGVNMVY